MKTVISKLQAATTYTQRIGDTVRGVTVGGHTTQLPGFLAPTHTCFEVSDEDADFLSKHGLFKQHQARGFVRIESTDPDNA
jgi:hypothetical protein